MAMIFTNTDSTSWNITITDGTATSDNVTWVMTNECVYEMARDNSISYQWDIPDAQFRIADEDAFEFQWDDDHWLKVVNVKAWWNSIPIVDGGGYEYPLGKNWMLIPL